MRVVFPAPFGPKMPNISPSSISRDKSSKAVIEVPFWEKIFEMDKARIIDIRKI
jgi:hypothetical protein